MGEEGKKKPKVLNTYFHIFCNMLKNQKAPKKKEEGKDDAIA